MNNEQQIKTFGETIEEMRDAVLFTRLDDPMDLNMYAMQILSDAQEVMTRGQTEQARQFINKAKYFMGEAQAILRNRERGGI